MRITKILFIVMLLATTGCISVKHDVKGRNNSPFNMIFTGYDSGISNPGNDRRSYYRVYIDKMESGRTTIGLESQEKTYSASLESNRHLLRVEKWVLDLRKGKYIKLNNINQPKPDYLYFNVPENGTVFIKMEIKTGNRSDFTISIK